jgi:AAA+ superfamily predicted ATPase
VKAVFTLASKISPSVIFIDEVLTFFLSYYMIPLGVGDLVCSSLGTSFVLWCPLWSD